MNVMDRLVSDLDEFSARLEDMRLSFETALAAMSQLPARPVDTPVGWMAKFQVRCSGCGRFARVLRGGDGYDSQTGEYDPWWIVSCKRCGEGEGFIPG